MSAPGLCRACRTGLGRRVHPRPTATSRRYLSTNSRYFRVSEEVQQAIAGKKPVVALESTIYTHGFPYPDNLALASRLESVVRLHGGVPATIGVLEGVARVGLAADELVRLVSAPAAKISRRDFGFVLGLQDAQGQGRNGGTTVSGTMVLAHKAGIRVFGTGGLGGVHRGAEQTMDVSADLTELGRTPVAVISSGCKSFLDIPKTLEYLETQGVAVATFADGRSGHVDFPAFYTRDSGIKSTQVLQTEEDAARIILVQHALGLQSGMHFANPIPEQFSVPFLQMEEAINHALAAATSAGAIGAASTPYILDKIKEITGSKSVEANTALVEANVIRATKVAAALQRLELASESGVDANLPSPSFVSTHSSNAGTSSSSAATSRTFSQHDTNIMKGLRKRGSTYQQIATRFNAGEHIASVVEAVRDSPARLAFGSESSHTHPKSTLSSPDVKANVVVAGSLAVDLACDFTPKQNSSLQSPELKTSNPAKNMQSLGGVGHNVARAAHLMGANVQLLSAVGDDLAGKAALEALSSAGMSTKGIQTLPSDSGTRTAQYVAINDRKKDLVLAMADMSILGTPSSTLTSTFSDFWLPQLRASNPTHLVLDGNWNPSHLGLWLSAARSLPTPPHITFEPVSTSKSTSLFSFSSSSSSSSSTPYPNSTYIVNLTTPNTHELHAMYTSAHGLSLFSTPAWWTTINALNLPATGSRAKLAFATSPALVDAGIPQQTIQLLPYIPCICTKLGPEGVLLTQLLAADDARLEDADYAPYILSRSEDSSGSRSSGSGSSGSSGIRSAEGGGRGGVGGIYMRLFPPVETVAEEDVVSVNGVGDSFAGVLVAALARERAETGREGRVEDHVVVAQRAAVLTLKSTESVSPELQGLL